MGLSLACASCATATDGVDSGPTDVLRRDAASAETGRSDAGGADASGLDADLHPEDNAVLVSATWPEQLGCGVTASATVTVRNTGTTTWTRAGGYKLGGVDDSDPLHPGDPRIELDDTETVLPGATRTFTVSLLGPAMAGTYLTDWRMLRERIHWFGDVSYHQVTDACAAPPDAGPTDTGPVDTGTPDPFDWGTATILNSPGDLGSWTESTRITRLEIGPHGVHAEFSKADGPGRWPDVTPAGWDGPIQYTLGMCLFIEHRWYCSAPIQLWYGLSESGGEPSGYAMNWFYDPGRWAPMTTHQPAVGETIGFFVAAGNLRNVLNRTDSLSVVERSNVVFVRMTDDSGAAYTFP